MSLFVRRGDGYLATHYTTGPWRPDAQHGGPPSALLARQTEALLRTGEVIARMSVELVRPVPLTVLGVAGERTEVSRRVSHIEATITHDATTVAVSRALVLRGGTLPRPAWAPAEPDPEAWRVPPPGSRVDPPAWAHAEAPVTYHQHAVEHRMTEGAFGEPGPATSWVRLLVPLVEGEDPSPFSRLLAAADFGSGISSVFGRDQQAGLINADLTVALARQPHGEWTVVRSETRAGPDGTGLCVSELGDEQGPVGVATQSLLGLTF